VGLLFLKIKDKDWWMLFGIPCFIFGKNSGII